MIDWRETCRQMSLELACHGCMALIVLAIGGAIVLWGIPPQPTGVIESLAVAGLVLCGGATAIVSLHVVFDAKLFMMMACSADKEQAGMKVDRLLSRLKVRAMPERPRPLADRVDGALSLTSCLHASLLAFLVLSAATTIPPLMSAV